MEDYNNILECKTKEEFYEWVKKIMIKKMNVILNVKKEK